MSEAIHIWEGPEKGLASGCSVLRLTITLLTGDYAEGEIMAKDYIEHGIVFSEPWEATKSSKDGSWIVKRKKDDSAFWIDRETGEAYFTINSVVNDAMKTFVSKRINIFIETGEKIISPDNKKVSKMDREMLKKSLQENRIFKIGNSFLFAAQIPDNSVGISGSRCSNCNEEVAYCEQRCRCCDLPFIGPFGFPQFSVWQSLSPDKKRMMVVDIYAHRNRGRLGYSNVEFVPLTPDELKKVEEMGNDAAEYFLSAHSISPRKIGKTLLVD